MNKRSRARRLKAARLAAVRAEVGIFGTTLRFNHAAGTWNSADRSFMNFGEVLAAFANVGREFTLTRAGVYDTAFIKSHR